MVNKREGAHGVLGLIIEDDQLEGDRGQRQHPLIIAGERSRHEGSFPVDNRSFDQILINNSHSLLLEAFTTLECVPGGHGVLDLWREPIDLELVLVHTMLTALFGSHISQALLTFRMLTSKSINLLQQLLLLGVHLFQGLPALERVLHLFHVDLI